MPQRGTYQTRQQEAVCALFASRPEDCLTAEEAYQALFKAGSDVSKTTVYRAISRLCQTGRLRRYAPSRKGGEAARYQHSPCTQSHLHIRCVDCGALAHLHCDEVEAFARHLGQHHGFTLDESPDRPLRLMRSLPEKTCEMRSSMKSIRRLFMFLCCATLLCAACAPVRPCLGSAAVHRVHDLPCL